jgi:enamine deaminase RidA (YjgF/YER057c/UK114 family)
VQGNVLHSDSVYEQCMEIWRKIERALESQQFSLSDIVRTRILLTARAFERFPDTAKIDVARAHREVVAERGGVRPACTLAVVHSLAHPDMLVEIETDAYKVAV